MARTIDYISLSLVFLALTFVWAALLFKNWIGALIFSAAFTLIVVFTVSYIAKKVKRPYSYERLALEFAIRGNPYVIGLLRKAIGFNELEHGGNYLVLENCVLISAFKFSILTVNDMGGICELAQKFSGKRIYVLTKGIDRHAFFIAGLENVKLNVVKIKTVYKFLSKHNALPNLKPIKQKLSFKYIIQVIFARANFKSYAFSGIILVLVSFITPLRIYYIVLGSISLLLAILTLSPLGNGSLASPRVLEELETAVKSNPQISIDDYLNDAK